MKYSKRGAFHLTHYHKIKYTTAVYFAEFSGGLSVRKLYQVFNLVYNRSDVM